MSATATTRIDLLLLGLLLDRSMHGYELFQQIQAEGIGVWFDVSQAGVYYSLGKLRDRGWVSESHQHSARSAGKSVYSLTDEGRAAFFAAMEAQATSREPVHLQSDLVIYLLNRLPLARATELLEQQISFLAEQVREIESTLAAETGAATAPLRLAMLDHKRRFLEMERQWLSDVVRDIQGAPAALDGLPIERPGLMTLRGDLRHFHLPDLIRLVASGGHTGRLVVSDGTELRILGFHDGQPCCAGLQSGSGPSESSPSQETVLARLYDLFRWGEGQFAFDQSSGCPQESVPLTCSAEELILAGCRWVDHWSIIQRLVPSSGSVFELGISLERLEEIGLTEAERRVIGASNGTQDVEAIAQALGLTLFEASRTLYALAAAGLVRSADLEKTRLRRVFRELAELMCASTVAWRTSPGDRTCEEEVNQMCDLLPLRLDGGRIADLAEPRLPMDELVRIYRSFLLAQIEVVSRRFGRERARQSYHRTLGQLAPELQEVARRHALDRLAL